MSDMVNKKAATVVERIEAINRRLYCIKVQAERLDKAIAYPRPMQTQKKEVVGKNPSICLHSLLDSTDEELFKIEETLRWALNSVGNPNKSEGEEEQQSELG